MQLNKYKWEFCVWILNLLNGSLLTYHLINVAYQDCATSLLGKLQNITVDVIHILHDSIGVL